MDEISKQIEAMAEKMEKASIDPKEKLFDVIKSLGKKGLQEKLAKLSDEEKLTLKAALEELTLKKAVEFDKEAQSAKAINARVEDTIIQEEIASDDADEKLMKPAAAKQNHQGTPTDGWDGQVIKSEELEKKQGVPKGANQATHERCVMHLKDQGHSKESAYRICNASGAGMKKAETIGEIEKSEDLMDQFISKMMERADEATVLAKCQGMGMDMKKVQGAVDKYKDKKKKDVKKSDEEIEKGKMKEKAMGKDEAKEKIMAMEQKEHGTKDPKKLVDAEKKEHGMKKAETEEEIEKAKKKMNKEEDQLGDAPEMNEKPMGKKTAAPDIEDNAKANKKNMTKSCSWEDENRLLKANTLGRNFNFNVEHFVEETLKSAEQKPTDLKKAETKKEDLNDLIEKSMDRNWDQVNHERRLAETKPNGGKLVKSFDEIEDLAAVMGISKEEAKKILGQ